MSIHPINIAPAYFPPSSSPASKKETPAETISSPLRQVFQTNEEMRNEFSKFLRTILYRLDEKKVFATVDKLLADRALTDEQVYRELLTVIDSQKKFPDIFQQLRALSVLKTGMGKQADELLKNFNRSAFHDYLEIYDRRYAKTLQKMANLPLDGKIGAVCDQPAVAFQDRLEAGALLSSYPYQYSLPLNAADCKNPLLEPEKTHEPLGKEIPDNSLDLVGCLGGLHHVPPEKKEAFAASLLKKLRPGGVLLFRDHDVINTKLWSIASVVHTFVNAGNKVSPEAEQKEIREFNSLDAWTEFMENQGFQRISPEGLILKDDPTANAMIAFVKKPRNLEELKQAAAYRKGCSRPKEGTRATWIEWGNVRFSKQYAEFIQAHPSYAFDYIGHLRQHWTHFSQFLKESRLDPEIYLKELLLSDSMAMNLFILSGNITQCALGLLFSAPQIFLARMLHGDRWRDSTELTDLDQFFARVEKEYSNSIDHTPFYMFPYFSKMKEMWSVIWNSKESLPTKASNLFIGLSSSLGFAAKAAVSYPIRAFYTDESNAEPETIEVLIRDQNEELEHLIARWEKEKDPVLDKNKKIETIYQTADGYKLISMPRYRPFTRICGYLAENSSIELIEIGGQKEISIDLIQKVDEKSFEHPKARKIYEMDRLQDPEKRRYATYSIPVSSLGSLIKEAGAEKIEYVHE